MKRLIDNNYKYITFAENESENANPLVTVPYKNGIDRTTDIKYKYFHKTEDTQPDIDNEKKYIELIDNNNGYFSVRLKTPEEMDLIDINEANNLKRISYFGRNIRIAIKLEDLEDEDRHTYKQTRALFKWCVAKKDIIVDAELIDNEEWMVAYMDHILPKHKQIIDAVSNILVFDSLINQDSEVIPVK